MKCWRATKSPCSGGLDGLIDDVPVGVAEPSDVGELEYLKRYKRRRIYFVWILETEERVQTEF